MSDTDRYAIGLEYVMSVELTPLVPKDEQGKPLVTEKVFLDSTQVSYIDSGPIDLNIYNVKAPLAAPVVRTVRSDYGFPLGELPIGTQLPMDRVYTETGRRLLFTKGRTENIQLKLVCGSHLGARIAAISHTGTVSK